MNFPLKKILFFILPFFLLGFADAKEADIVKQEGREVYLDISQISARPAVGDSFTITLPGEEIINPKTGQKLGTKDGEIIFGKIRKIKGLYALGFLSSAQQTEGLKAVFSQSKPKKQKDNTILFEAEFPENPLWQPLWTSKPLQKDLLSAAVCDIDSDNSNELILGFKNGLIEVFVLDENTQLKGLYSYKLSSGKKLLNLDCADIKLSGRAVIFANTLETAENKFYIQTLELEDGQLSPTNTLEGLTQGLAPYYRPRVIYTQKLIRQGDENYLSKPAKLTFKNGKYKTDKPLAVFGLSSIFGFNMADFKNDGTANAVYIDGNGNLRIQFETPKDFVVSAKENNFLRSPNTFYFKGKKQSIPLPLAVLKNGKDLFISAVQTNKKTSSELYLFKWTGLSLAKYKTADLPGKAVDLKQGSFGPFKDILIVPYNSNEESFIAVYAAENI